MNRFQTLFGSFYFIQIDSGWAVEHLKLKCLWKVSPSLTWYCRKTEFLYLLLFWIIEHRFLLHNSCFFYKIIEIESNHFEIMFNCLYLKILTGKKYRQIKFQRSQMWTNVDIWIVGTSNQLFIRAWKYNVVTGKTPFFVIGSLCTYPSVYLNTGFWFGSFCMKIICIFILSTFNWKMIPQFFRKRFSFYRKSVSKLKYWKRSKFPLIVT